MSPKLFPTVLIILCLLASIVWFYQGDWRKTVYWLAAAVLNFVVTY